MKKNRFDRLRIAVLVFGALLIAAFIIKTVFSSPEGGDALFLIFRWPVFVLVVIVPLVVVRILLWKQPSLNKPGDFESRGKNGAPSESPP